MRDRDRRIAEGILFTDEYELTMAHLYYRMGIHKKDAQFDYFFRNYPDYGEHKAGYCINAGMEWLVNWMQDARFGDMEYDLLKNQKGRTGKPLFHTDFLDWMKNEADFNSLNIMSIPEGRVVHPDVPLTVVQGPLATAQILESSLLNHLNFQTLIATKASRISYGGRGQLLLEFGMRRGHGRGVNAGVRGALIGGADFSSNTGISHVLGFPPKGTHAHSMVQAFMAMGEGEIGAFRAYADVYPDDCLLLVDTINTLESGIPNAIKVFEDLEKKGHEPFGIRLDSGDLAHLAIRSAKMLNDAGFPDTKIVLSNKLDEITLWQILNQIEKEAPDYGIDADHLIKRLVYGVGTRLITSRGNAALDGVYKLVAVRSDNSWKPAIKLSESPSKTVNPGFKRVWRIYNGKNKSTADLLCLHDENPEEWDQIFLQHPVEKSTRRILNSDEIEGTEPLLEKIIWDGELKTSFPDIDQIRKVRDNDLERLDSGVKRLINPHRYHVSLSRNLWNLKQELIQSFQPENASSSIHSKDGE